MTLLLTILNDFWYLYFCLWYLRIPLQMPLWRGKYKSSKTRPIHFEPNASLSLHAGRVVQPMCKVTSVTISCNAHQVHVVLATNWLDPYQAPGLVSFTRSPSFATNPLKPQPHVNESDNYNPVVRVTGGGTGGRKVYHCVIPPTDT